MAGNDKQFDNIVQAFAYARETKDMTELNRYLEQRVKAMGTHFMPFVADTRGDDMYFMLAYMSAFLQLQIGVMNPKEREIVEMIRRTIQITYIRMNLPFKQDGIEGTNE